MQMAARSFLPRGLTAKSNALAPPTISPSIAGGLRRRDDTGWPLGNQTLWTIFNRNEYDEAGLQMSVPYRQGMHYFDSYHGIELDLPPENSARENWSSLVIDPPRKTTPREVRNFGRRVCAIGCESLPGLWSRLRLLLRSGSAQGEAHGV